MKRRLILAISLALLAVCCFVGHKAYAAPMAGAVSPIRWLEWARDGGTVYGIVQNEASVRAWDVPKLARD